jgi:polyribonucleotide 5'-hydroxyl-kinase
VVQNYELNEECELRFEVDWSEKIQLKMTKGKAEIFGNEIAIESVYEFYGGTKASVFTWHGCELEVRGNLKVAYVASETPMVSYLNLHLNLDELRRNAKTDGKQGPRVMIIGPPDSGKTTLAKIMLGYGLKRAWNPIFVDLDPNDGTLIAPTTIGAVAVNRAEVQESFGFSFIASPPIIYYYGDTSPAKNAKFFNQTVNTLAEVVIKRLEADEHTGHSGLVIDTHSWTESVGYDTFLQAIDAFQVDLIFIVGSERLHSDLSNKLKDYPRKIVVTKVAKSGGVVTRETLFRKQMHMRKVREYFYGTPNNEFAPYTSSVSFSEVSVRRIGEGFISIYVVNV